MSGGADDRVPVFERLGGEPGVRALVDRFHDLMELEPRFAALRPVDQIALLAALNAGSFDAWPAALLARLRAALPGWLDTHAAALVQAAQQGGALDAAAQAALVEQVAALCRELGGGAP